MTTDISALFPGIVVQKNLTDALALWVAEHGAVSDADVRAVLELANSLGPPAYPLFPVPYPSGMERWPHSNASPDGWTIVDNETEVLAGSP